MISSNSPNTEALKDAVYLAARGFENELKHELGKFQDLSDRAFLSDPRDDLVWPQDVWRDVVKIRFESISQAAKSLKALHKNWVLFSTTKHRRAALIQEQLPKFQTPRITFKTPPVSKPFGCWMLIDDKTLIASTNTQNRAPLGIYEFVEDKIFPPNRAYLKLWEGLTRLKKIPRQGDVCFDLGSSPGGWTWVLQTLGAQVISVDKADLAKNILQLPNIEFRKQSAFSLKPADFKKVDWLCCDVACYPDRLYDFLLPWIESGVCENFVCTLKLQGKTDFEVIEKFKKIPDSRVIHLYHNKHEVTWICGRDLF